MDALKQNVITALETAINESEDCLCRITQDPVDESLIIKNDIGHKTVMNCRLNSVRATIRQICKHIINHDLFSYEPDYVIGG